MICLTLREVSTMGIGLVIVGLILLIVLHGKRILTMNTLDRIGVASLLLGGLVWLFAELCEHYNA